MKTILSVLLLAAGLAAQTSAPDVLAREVTVGPGPADIFDRLFIGPHRRLGGIWLQGRVTADCDVLCRRGITWIGTHPQSWSLHYPLDCSGQINWFTHYGAVEPLIVVRSIDTLTHLYGRSPPVALFRVPVAARGYEFWFEFQCLYPLGCELSTVGTTGAVHVTIE